MSHIRCQRGQYCYLSISSTVAPWFVSWPIRNQVWVVRRWQLASRRRLLQFACQPGASQGIQRDGDHFAPHCPWLRHCGCEVAVRLTYSPDLTLFFWWWTTRLHDVWKFSWLAVELLIAQEWRCDSVFLVCISRPPSCLQGQGVQKSWLLCPEGEGIDVSNCVPNNMTQLWEPAFPLRWWWRSRGGIPQTAGSTSNPYSG